MDWKYKSVLNDLLRRFSLTKAIAEIIDETLETEDDLKYEDMVQKLEVKVRNSDKFKVIEDFNPEEDLLNYADFIITQVMMIYFKYFKNILS